ncbi:helix-turn-helix domain-containing transcriptional regulator [Sphingomonas hylomeconis]|uniref:DNA-binding protein n=1 Tax=Sphingomonas hylomeconis TaxID=1395958 RepID=A0ABV7STG1_9SPHN|nr:transcriptional regulator [Sphingomonas hylomeconis]
MAIETTRWDVVDRLDSEEMILAYLEAVFEDGDPALIAAALNDVARAQGRHPALDLSPGADIGALIRAMKSLGLELTAKAA